MFKLYYWNCCIYQSGMHSVALINGAAFGSNHSFLLDTHRSASTELFVWRPVYVGEVMYTNMLIQNVCVSVC